MSSTWLWLTSPLPPLALSSTHSSTSHTSPSYSSRPSFQPLTFQDHYRSKTGGVDWYAALGLPHNATDHEIRSAYLHLARYFHSDKLSSVPTSDTLKSYDQNQPFVRIQDAYHVLSQSALRQAYDRHGHLGPEACSRITEDSSYRSEEFIKQRIDSMAHALQKEKTMHKDTLQRHTDLTTRVDATKLVASLLRDEPQSNETSLQRPRATIGSVVYGLPPSINASRQQRQPISGLVKLLNITVNNSTSYSPSESHTFAINSTFHRQQHKMTGTFIADYAFTHKPTNTETEVAVAAGEKCSLAASITRPFGNWNNAQWRSRFSPDHGLLHSFEIGRTFSSDHGSQNKPDKGEVSFILNDTCTNINSITLQGRRTLSKKHKLDVTANLTCDHEDVTGHLKVTKRFRHRSGKRHFASVSAGVRSVWLHSEPLSINKLNARLQTSTSMHYHIAAHHQIGLEVITAPGGISAILRYHYMLLSISIPIQLVPGSATNDVRWLAFSAVPFCSVLFAKLFELLTRHRKRRVVREVGCNVIGKQLVQLRTKAMEKQISLASVAKQIRKQEQRSKGLVILAAWYNFSTSKSFDPLFPDAIDATIPVQALVNNSSVWFAAPLHRIPGLYDPSEILQKAQDSQLSITYTYRGNMYHCVVGRDENLYLPNVSAHTHLQSELEQKREIERIEMLQQMAEDRAVHDEEFATDE